MTSPLISLLPVLSDDRTGSLQASSRECDTAGSNRGADGVNREDTPVPFDSPEPREGAEKNLIDRRGAEIVTLIEEQAASDLEEGRSPVEEEGHEEEADEDEELGSAVEEGEEAALALDVPPTEVESDISWLPIVQASLGHSREAGPLPCHSLEEGSHHMPGTEEVPNSILACQAPDSSSTNRNLHCQIAQIHNGHRDNLA